MGVLISSLNFSVKSLLQSVDKTEIHTHSKKKSEINLLDI